MPKEAEEMRKRVLKQLKKAHPKCSEEKLNSTAYAIVQSHYKKKGKAVPFKKE